MRILFAVIASLCIFSGFAGPTYAVPVVTFDLIYAGDGTYDLFASASLDDNEGIASYGVPLTNVVSVDHKSPNALGTGSLGNQGVAFTLLRSADGIAALTASQDTFAPGYVAYGLGQTPGDLASDSTPVPTSLAFPEQAVYDVPLLIASGTWDPVGATPGVDTASLDFGSNVFISRSSLDVVAATVVANVVPEPGCLGLALLGLALAFFTRLR